MDELLRLRRPLWRRSLPPMWVGPDRIRIGDVTLDRMAPAHVMWIMGLDGLRTSRQVLRELPIELHDAARIVRGLLAAGALQDAAFAPSPLRLLTAQAREALMARYEAAFDVYRDPAMSMRAVRLRDRALVRVTGDDAVRTEIETCLLDAGLTLAHDSTRHDVTVLADAPHPDVPRSLDDPLHRQPHLHVGIHGERAIVGPLVVPGETSCLRCTQLHRRDRDAAWAMQAVQWSQFVPGPRDPLLVRLSAAHAAAVIRLYADRPEAHNLWSGSAWEITLPSASVTRMDRPSHPLCGCQWTAA